MDNQQQSKEKDPAKWMLWTGIILILGLPWLLTRTWGLFHFNDSTGVIGDTIGGITAPVSGFLGAYLVYRALKAQIEANEAINRQFSIQQQEDAYRKSLLYITERLKILRDDIKDFEIVAQISERNSQFGSQKSAVTHRGVEAIAFALKTYSRISLDHGNDIDTNMNAHLAQIKYFLETVHYLLSEFLNEEKYHITDRENLRMIVIEVYKSKLYHFLNQNKKSCAVVCTVCGRPHAGLPPSIYHLFDSINEKLSRLNISN